jgi:dCTP diphosphatase
MSLIEVFKKYSWCSNFPGLIIDLCLTGRYHSDTQGQNVKPVDIPKIHNEISKFIAERDWNQFHSIKNLSMALSVESSELLEIFQWLKEEDSNKVSSTPALKAKVEEELADIFVYLLRVAHKSEIDLEKVVLDKIRKNSEKYPADKVKGSSKKYTEY